MFIKDFVLIMPINSKKKMTIVGYRVRFNNIVKSPKFPIAENKF